MDYKLTVFTPCYNGEKTIHRVFESMNAQTYTNWEWIIINDGSTDNSDCVIKELIAESKWGGGKYNTSSKRMLVSTLRGTGL